VALVVWLLFCQMVLRYEEPLLWKRLGEPSEEYCKTSAAVAPALWLITNRNCVRRATGVVVHTELHKPQLDSNPPLSSVQAPVWTRSRLMAIFVECPPRFGQTNPKEVAVLGEDTTNRALCQVSRAWAVP
jgi:hypothetical protein